MMRFLPVVLFALVFVLFLTRLFSFEDKSYLEATYDFPADGNPSGDVTVVAWLDYDDARSKEAAKALLQLMAEDAGVRVVYRGYPFGRQYCPQTPKSDSYLSAKWALAAQKQGKFVPFHNALTNTEFYINGAELRSVTRDLGLDMDRMKKDADSKAVMDQLKYNRDAAAALHIDRAPAFVVGTQVVVNAMDIDTLHSMVRRQRGG
jgi:protein-disulfide isomerase